MDNMAQPPLGTDYRLKISLAIAVLLVIQGVTFQMYAQQGTLVANTSAYDEAETVTPLGRSARDAAVQTRTSARVINMKIPAPRGVITDRNGKPFATNKVSYQFGLRFPEFRNPTDKIILTWVANRLSTISGYLGKEVTLRDKSAIEHYHNRRWIPLFLPHIVTPEQRDKWHKSLPKGIVLQARYLRYYPQHARAAHIVGYVRSTGKLETGPITQGEPIWEDTYGAEGLEQIYDERLRGIPGEKRLLYDSDGSELQNEVSKNPIIGDTIVTTLDLEWQQHAENVLRRSCKRGAFVVIDIQTGDVLALASRPSYDINVWIPHITPEEYGKLRDDSSNPMFARAFRSAYPPASSFKPVVAATALTNGDVGPNERIDCPAWIRIGSRKFNNHSKKPDGRINVAYALARSNNVWFYKVGMRTGPSAFLSLARRMGFGTVTGLPLYGEASGRIPTNEYMIEKEGRPMTDGDTANAAIGQGEVTATPLQVAQAMAGIANGNVLPRLRLIKQIQDHKGNVLEAPRSEERNALNLSHEAVEHVHKGMMQVVHATYGTGKRGTVDFCKIAGKTGTAQWKGSYSTGNKYELAWFAGFLPYENPRYAFAALYEGSRNESVSGGKKAAPMIPRFFNPFAKSIMEAAKPPKRAAVIEEESEEEPLLEEEEEIPDAKSLILRALPDVNSEAPKQPSEGEAENVEPTDPPLRAEPLEESPQADEPELLEADESENAPLRAEPIEPEETQDAEPLEDEADEAPLRAEPLDPTETEESETDYESEEEDENEEEDETPPPPRALPVEE